MDIDVLASPQKAFEPPLSAGTQAALEFDAQRYLPELDNLEIGEAQKLELLGILHSIMRSFVELGLSVEHCGHLLPDFNKLADVDVQCGLERTETPTQETEAL